MSGMDADDLSSCEDLVRLSLRSHLPKGLALDVETADTNTALKSKKCGRQKGDVKRVSKAGYRRSPYSYTALIEQALTEEGMLTVKQIYKWIKDHSDYYRYLDGARWQSAVRHALSVSKKFCKLNKTSAGNFWTLASKTKKAGGPITKKDHWKKQKIAEYQKNENPLSVEQEDKPKYTENLNDAHKNASQVHAGQLSSLPAAVSKKLHFFNDNRNRSCDSVMEDPLPYKFHDILDKAEEANRLLTVSASGKQDGAPLSPQYPSSSSSTDTCPSPQLVLSSTSEFSDSELEIKEQVPLLYHHQRSLVIPFDHSYSKEMSTSYSKASHQYYDANLALDPMGHVQLADVTSDSVQPILADTMWNKASIPFHSPPRQNFSRFPCHNPAKSLCSDERSHTSKCKQMKKQQKKGAPPLPGQLTVTTPTPYHSGLSTPHDGLHLGDLPHRMFTGPRPMPFTQPCVPSLQFWAMESELNGTFPCNVDLNSHAILEDKHHPRRTSSSEVFHAVEDLPHHQPFTSDIMGHCGLHTFCCPYCLPELEQVTSAGSTSSNINTGHAYIL